MSKRSKHSELFAELAKPFEPILIKMLKKGGTEMPYVDARTVMNRLDNVVGPENWWDEYKVIESSVECKLSIRLPDGEIIPKIDVGARAGMKDEGDDDKSGYSDAFKRAAVKFGIGRHLYDSGLPEYVMLGIANKSAQDTVDTLNAGIASYCVKQTPVLVVKKIAKEELVEFIVNRGMAEGVLNPTTDMEYGLTILYSKSSWYNTAVEAFKKEKREQITKPKA